MTDQTMTTVSIGCGCAACHGAANNATSDEYADNNSYSSTQEGNEARSTDMLDSSWSTNNLQFKFITDTPTYYASNAKEQNNFSQFNSQMRAATVRILEQVESFTNLNFSETSNEYQDNTLTFGQASREASNGGFAYYPHPHQSGGDVWINNVHAYNQTPVEGNYAFYTLMHEVGHALGLVHSFQVYSGAEASSQFSVMAYDRSPYLSETFQLYDIAALQSAYGANTSYRTGDDIYTLESGVAYTIWDAGGIDTFNASHITTDVILDLTEGSFSSVGLSNNIAIAYGALIENATGGSGDDILAGNDADNILRGNGGNDTFYESDGNDILDGGNGDDTAIFDTALSNFFVLIINSFTLSLQNTISFFTNTVSYIENFIFDGVSHSFNELANMFGVNTIDGGGERDRIEGTDLNDEITGLAGDDELKGGLGNDLLQGGADNDHLFGDGGFDTLNGGIGNDYLYGGDDSDTLNGDDGQDWLYGQNGDDILNGGAGRDLLSGGDGQDTLRGGNDNDRLDGNDGDDTLFGEFGRDVLIGGNGNDSLYGGEGNDFLKGLDDNDILSGELGNDRLYGNNGDDVLYGGDGDDKLYGGDGIDRLNGGAGTNRLYGGAGNDIFELNSETTAQNMIMDFNKNEDVILLDEVLIDFDDGVDNISDFVRTTQVGATLQISVDEDGADNGANFVTIGSINSFGGMTAEDMFNDGILVPN